MGQLEITKGAYCTSWVITGIIMLSYAGYSFAESKKDYNSPAEDWSSYADTSGILLILTGVFLILAAISVFMMWKDDKCTCGLWTGTIQQKVIAVYAVCVEASGIFLINLGAKFQGEFADPATDAKTDSLKIFSILAGTFMILGAVILNCSWGMGKDGQKCPTWAQTGTFVWAMMAGQAFVQIMPLFEEFNSKNKTMSERQEYVGIWFIVGGLSALLHSVNAWVTFPPSDIVEQMSA